MPNISKGGFDLSIHSAYNTQSIASAYSKSALSKHPNSINDPESTSNIKVVKSGQKVLVDEIKNAPKTNPLKKDIEQKLHDSSYLNSQNIKKAIFGNSDKKLLNQIENTLNINDFSKKVKNVNVYVDEMVSNIKEIMDTKGIMKEAVPADNYKRFNVTV